MVRNREVIKGPLSLGEPKHILVEPNKTIQDLAIIAGGHVVLRKETGMSFGAGLGKSRLRINFVPMKVPDVICSFDHAPAIFDGNGACKSSDTPKGAISVKHSWSGYCGDLAFQVLLIFGVKCLDVQVSNKLLVLALICPSIMGCSATDDCTEVVVEFEFCSEYCNTVDVSPSLDCCIKLSAAASINENSTSAPCTCYMAKHDTYTEFKCHTAKLILLYEFCGVPVNQFPYICKGVVLPPLQRKLAPPPPTTDKTPQKKKSLLASLWGCFKIGVYIVGSLLTLCVVGLSIWRHIRSLVLNRPEEGVVGTQLADLAIATGNLSSGLAPA